MGRNPIKVSELFFEKGFSKVNILQLFGFLIGGPVFALGYTATDQYLDRAIVCFVCGIIQTIILLTAILFNRGSGSNLTVNRFLVTLYLPVTFAPAACLYIDSTATNIHSGISGVVIEKRIEKHYVRGSRAESKILVVNTQKEIIREAVIWSFYDLVEIGDHIGIDVRQGLLGFRKVVEYYKF